MSRCRRPHAYQAVAWGQKARSRSSVGRWRRRSARALVREARRASRTSCHCPPGRRPGRSPDCRSRLRFPPPFRCHRQLRSQCRPRRCAVPVPVPLPPVAVPLPVPVPIPPVAVPVPVPIPPVAVPVPPVAVPVPPVAVPCHAGPAGGGAAASPSADPAGGVPPPVPVPIAAGASRRCRWRWRCRSRTRCPSRSRTRCPSHSRSRCPSRSRSRCPSHSRSRCPSRSRSRCPSHSRSRCPSRSRSRGRPRVADRRSLTKPEWSSWWSAWSVSSDPSQPQSVESPSRPRSVRRSPSRPRSGWSLRSVVTNAWPQPYSRARRMSRCPKAARRRGTIAGPGGTRACRSRWNHWCRAHLTGSGRGRALSETRNTRARRMGGDHRRHQMTRADAQPHDRQRGRRDGGRRNEAIADEERLGPGDHLRHDVARASLRKRVSERTRREDLFQGRVIVRNRFWLRFPHDPPAVVRRACAYASEFRLQDAPLPSVTTTLMAPEPMSVPGRGMAGIAFNPDLDLGKRDFCRMPGPEIPPTLRAVVRVLSKRCQSFVQRAACTRGAGVHPARPAVRPARYYPRERRKYRLSVSSCC